MNGVYLALGSNLGDRAAYIQGAVDALHAADGVRVISVSRVYETEPVGGPPQPDYLNAVVSVDTRFGARALLALAQSIESAAGRLRGASGDDSSGVRWGPRTLDVDVLVVGNESVDEPDLVVPHPRMTERAFVLAPLADLDPELVAELAPDLAAELVDRQVSGGPPGWRGVRRTEVRLAVPKDR